MAEGHLDRPGRMNIVLTVAGVLTADGEQPGKVDVEWPEGWPIPREGDRVSLPDFDEPLRVRVLEWYPQGDEDHAEGFVYIVIGKPRSGW